MARERTSSGFLLFSGNSHKKLAEDIARYVLRILANPTRSLLSKFFRRVDQPLANLILKNGDDGGICFVYYFIVTNHWLLVNYQNR